MVQGQNLWTDGIGFALRMTIKYGKKSKCVKLTDHVIKRLKKWTKRFEAVSHRHDMLTKSTSII